MQLGMALPSSVGIPGPNKGLLKLLSHPQWGSSLPPVLLPLLVPVRHQLMETLSALLASNEQLWRGHSLCSLRPGTSGMGCAAPWVGELLLQEEVIPWVLVYIVLKKKA